MSAPAEARFFSRRWLVAIAVMSSAVMEVLDTSVVNLFGFDSPPLAASA